MDKVTLSILFALSSSSAFAYEPPANSYKIPVIIKEHIVNYAAGVADGTAGTLDTVTKAVGVPIPVLGELVKEAKVTGDTNSKVYNVGAIIGVANPETLAAAIGYGIKKGVSKVLITKWWKARKEAKAAKMELEAFKNRSKVETAAQVKAQVDIAEAQIKYDADTTALKIINSIPDDKAFSKAGDILYPELKKK